MPPVRGGEKEHSKDRSPIRRGSNARGATGPPFVFRGAQGPSDNISRRMSVQDRGICSCGGDLMKYAKRSAIWLIPAGLIGLTKSVAY